MKILVRLAVVLGAVILAATATIAGASTSARKKQQIAFVGADLPDPFYRTMRCGAFAAARKFRVSLSWQGTNGVDFQPELTIFNAVRQRKPDGIILAPFSPTAFIQPVRSTMRSGIPVVTVDGTLARRVELQNIHTDNLRSGALAADAMARFLRGGGKVAIIAFAPDIPVQRDRVNGFRRRAAAKHRGIRVVAVEYGGADTSKAAQVTAALLQRHPDLAGVYGTDTSDAEGAGSAILAAGKRGRVKLVGYDAGPKAVSGLKSGLFDALVAQSPYDEGYQAVKTLAQVLRGQVKRSRVKYRILTGGAVITKANMNKRSVRKFIYRSTC